MGGIDPEELSVIAAAGPCPIRGGTGDPEIIPEIRHNLALSLDLAPQLLAEVGVADRAPVGTRGHAQQQAPGDKQPFGSMRV